MKAKIILILFLLLFLATGFAFTNQEISAFNRANVYYEQGNYDEAIKQYNSILESGYESGNLYYNLGNCYFKKQELGKAILNYEKARRLLPRDLDLASNYEYACSLIKGRVLAPQKSLPLRLLSGGFDRFTIDGLTILLSVLYLLLLGSILSSFIFRPFRKQALWLALFLLVFFVSGLLALRGKIALLHKEAIIIAEQAEAKFEPKDSATTYFTLYAGMKVEVFSSEANWRKIKRLDHKSGWVESSAVTIF